MKFLNSLIARIWGPFLLMALSLTLLVGFYIPSRQKATFREFQTSELNELVKSVAANISIAGKYDDWSNLNNIYSGLSSRPSLEYSALILETGERSFVAASNPPDLTMDAFEAARTHPLFVSASFEGGVFKGMVVAKGSETFLKQEMGRLNFPLQVATALILFGVTLLYFFLWRKVSSPLRMVRNVAEGIREGNLTTPVDVDSRIWELRSLNLALERLRSGLLEQRKTNDVLTKGMEKEIQRQTKDLRKTLNELQETRNLFGSVIESALDAMIIADGKSRIVEWNNKAEDIFGWSRDEALGQSISKLIIPHDYREAHDRGMDHYHSTGHGPVLNKSFQIQALRRNGEVFDIELYITPVQLDNQQVFSSFIRDITESKRMAQDLEQQRELNAALLNSLPMLVSLKDRDLRYTFINDRALEVLGKQREDMVGRREDEVFSTDWVAHSMEMDQRVWNGEHVDPEENTLERNGIEQHFVIGRFQLSVGKEHPKSYLLTYGFEVSQLKAAQKQLQEAMKTKDEFLATISHEIRTPLHSIIVLAELLNQANRKDEHEEFAQNIRSSSRHLLDLVNDILDFSKADAERLELAPIDVDMEEFTAGLNRVETGQHISDVAFVKDIKGCEGITVQVDRTRLNQVLQNLMSNAFKFTAQGEVRLSVEGQREGDRFLMDWKISDTGIGIAKNDQSKVLEAFEQAHSGISREFGGTGLGLGIVVKLLQLMDSTLEIESDLGQGATFKFRLDLPLAGSMEDNVTQPDAKTRKLNGLKMLYVEDMIPNQMVMQAMCRPLDIDLSIVSSGHEALELCQEKNFDLILMDIQMPGMDGIETMQHIRGGSTSNAKTSIHAFTAQASPEYSEELSNLGFAGVLTKPLTPLQLEDFLKANAFS